MGQSFPRSSCSSWELECQEDVAGVGEHPGEGVYFWDGGASAKQDAVLAIPTASQGIPWSSAGLPGE